MFSSKSNSNQLEVPPAVHLRVNLRLQILHNLLHSILQLQQILEAISAINQSISSRQPKLRQAVEVLVQAEDEVEARRQELRQVWQGSQLAQVLTQELLVQEDQETSTFSATIPSSSNYARLSKRSHPCWSLSCSKSALATLSLRK